MGADTRMTLKFVKYANRKIHEEGSTIPYTSMDKLAAFIVEGKEIEVVDDSTGDDITLETLARVLYDFCRAAGGDELNNVEAIASSVVKASKRALRAA